jgi:hypothetical protein
MEIWLPLVSALIGAVIGAAGSVLTVWITGRAETRRHRMQVITQLALKDREIAIDAAKHSGGRTGIPPTVVYLDFYGRVLDLIEKGDFNQAAFKKVHEAQDALIKVAEQINPRPG